MSTSDTIIEIENLSKQYRLGQVSTGTVAHDINRWWARLRGKGDPTLQVTHANDRSQRALSRDEYVWALEDINFEVKKGEVLGIIGRNGAGKSTLLKILSRVTAPTSGEIRLNGSLASLLEVGTGFHHELTGRENIFLNGAILGMTKAEIQSKLDEIVEFSGCARYLDTPVKRYSSGMMVRLGFAVAAHLEPDILVVDEVLAVGDAEFQKKCIGKMQDVASQGRTVLFVSHNMTAVASLCDRIILLSNGQVACDGLPDEVISMYLNGMESEPKHIFSADLRNGSGEVKVLDAVLDGHPLCTWKPLVIRLTIGVEQPVAFDVSVAIRSISRIPLCQAYSQHSSESFCMEPGCHQIQVQIPAIPLSPGTYRMNLWLGKGIRVFDWVQDAFVLDVMGHELGQNKTAVHQTSYPIVLKAEWSVCCE